MLGERQRLHSATVLRVHFTFHIASQLALRFFLVLLPAKCLLGPCELNKGGECEWKLMWLFSWIGIQSVSMSSV